MWRPLSRALGKVSIPAKSRATFALTLPVPAFASTANDVFTPLKSNSGTEEQPHGGFVAFTDGEITASTFLL